GAEHDLLPLLPRQSRRAARRHGAAGNQVGGDHPRRAPGMRFRPRAYREEPEINFIPLIDVLLVILIFLMVTTTYSRYSELKINLPTAEAPKTPERVNQIDIAVDAKGAYSVNKNVIGFANRDVLVAELKRAATGMKDPV